MDEEARLREALERVEQDLAVIPDGRPFRLGQPRVEGVLRFVRCVLEGKPIQEARTSWPTSRW